MGKGPSVTRAVQELLARIYVRNRAIRPTEARTELLASMKERGLHELFGPDYPSVSTVSVYLKKFRERDEARTHEANELDKPWSIRSISRYPIAPEALRIVLHLWVWTLENLKSELTIREAQWASRLYSACREMTVGALSVVVRAYAGSERVAELTGEYDYSAHAVDLLIFASVTNEEIPTERVEALLGKDTTETWHMDVSNEELALLRELVGDGVGVALSPSQDSAGDGSESK